MSTRVRNTTSRPAGPGRAEVPRVTSLVERLAATWPDAVVELDHANAYQLLCATILAAQSTDRMINTITPALFARFPDAHALAAADQDELERLVHKSGFFRNKAKALRGMAQALVERHAGEVPRTMDELVALPGVARKTANVILGSAYGIDAGVVVDTHVTRLSARLGLTRETDPVKIERDLMAVLPQEHWTSFAHRLIWHGRRVCHARAPDCGACALAPLCPSADLPARGEAVAGPRHGKAEEAGPGPRPMSGPSARPVVAVAALVFDEDGRVLLVERGRPPGVGLWTVPGGKLELGESLAAAVAREVAEETGLIVEAGPLVEVVERVVPADPADPAAGTFHYVILDYLAHLRGGALAAGDDVRAARFVDDAGLRRLPLTDGLEPVIDRARAVARGLVTPRR
jgi:endonuclease-3